MKQHLKVLAALVATAFITAALTSYLVEHKTTSDFINEFTAVAAVTQIDAIESLDRIESLLAKGCNSEALKMVRIEQASALYSLKNQSSLTPKAMQKASSRNADIVERAMKASPQPRGQLPSCN